MSSAFLKVPQWLLDMPCMVFASKTRLKSSPSDAAGQQAGRALPCWGAQGLAMT